MMHLTWALVESDDTLGCHLMTEGEAECDKYFFNLQIGWVTAVPSRAAFGRAFASFLQVAAYAISFLVTNCVVEE